VRHHAYVFLFHAVAAAAGTTRKARDGQGSRLWGKEGRKTVVGNEDTMVPVSKSEREV